MKECGDDCVVVYPKFLKSHLRDEKMRYISSCFPVLLLGYIGSLSFSLVYLYWLVGYLYWLVGYLYWLVG